MKRPTLSRRELLTAGGAAIATTAFLNNRWVSAAPLKQGDEVLPWIDQPEDNRWAAIVGNQLEWEKVDTWITPPDQFFNVSRYGNPEIEVDDWQLEITGLVDNPMTLSMADLQNWPRQELDYTLECSGNHGYDWIWGLIGNARWAGVALTHLLQEAGVKDDAVEVAFYGADSGEVTVREQTFSQRFARSMSIEDAISPYNILCYEMNGKPLPTRHGFPLRLIAPGWYGVANVKWLERIEVRSRRMMNQFMARDYVTLRKEEIDGEEVWTESSVGHGLLKSAPARVVRNGETYRIEGAAWGRPISRVQVQIDNGRWQTATLDTENVRHFSWRFWTLDWPDVEPGEHTITSRAIDTERNIQPAADDPLIANKLTYWESNGQITRRVMIPA
jgi:DMSO/TMAO reductase YedYZ molybdopterin-dependent catalytic subunit